MIVVVSPSIQGSVQMAWSGAEEEPLETAFVCEEENELSSSPDSVFSEDEDYFAEGIDPCQDISTATEPQQLSGPPQGEQHLPPSEGESHEDEEFLPKVRGRRRLTPQACKRGPKSDSRSRSPGGRSRGRNPSASTPCPPAQARRWKTEDESDSLPQPLPRFCPRRSPGIQPPLADAAAPSPVKLFKLFFDKKAIQVLCDNTNKNAAKKLAAGQKFQWFPVTPEELCKYMGLLFYMGVLKLPSLCNFWRVKHFFHVPSPAEVLHRDRFLLISRTLHMSDPEEDAVNDEKKGTEDYDGLHRLRPLYDSLRTACKAAYHPQKNLAVHERMVTTKAKLRLKQCIKNKPKKWGVKLFVLTDSSGYTFDFNISTGKNKSASGKGLSFDAVAALVNKDYLGSGYHIYCDHFYTSPALFRHLWDLGFGACGAYSVSRMGTPATTDNALTNCSPRGSLRWIRDGQLLFVKWMDIREVSVCSTVHIAYSGETVMRGRKTSNGYERVAVPRPTCVGEYTRFMEGVDLSEQLSGSYSTGRRSRKWYKTVFHHFLDVAATNSYILHRQLCASSGKQPLSHQAFHELLSAELCGVSLIPSVFQPDREKRHHTPVAIATGFPRSMRASLGRRKCKICGRSTPFQCCVCKVALCVILDRNCHDDFHNEIQSVDGCL